MPTTTRSGPRGPRQTEDRERVAAREAAAAGETATPEATAAREATTTREATVTPAATAKRQGEDRDLRPENTQEPAERDGRRTGGGLAVPVLLPWVHVAHVRLPSPKAVASRAGEAAEAVRMRLPERQRVAYYGGLTALAVLGLVEWPVAAAVAAGVWVAGHRQRAAIPGSEARSDAGA